MFLEKKTANGIKMVRFTRNDSCFLRLGDLCEFQGIKTAAAPKQEETLQDPHGNVFLCNRSEKAFMRVKSLQACLTLCDPMDCSLPGTSDCGIPSKNA